MRPALPLVVGLSLLVGPAVAQAPPQPKTGLRYQVRKGERLSDIAQRHGVPLQKMMRANGILNPDQLFAGEILRIPGNGKAGAAAAPSGPAPAPPPPPATAAGSAPPTAHRPPLPASLPPRPRAAAAGRPREGAAAPAPPAGARVLGAAQAAPARTAPRSETPAPARAAAASTTATASSDDSKRAPEKPGTPLLGTRDRDLETPESLGLGATLLDILWKLALVLALAYGTLLAVRKWSGQQILAPGAGGMLQALEALPLGASRSLQIVRVGERVLVLGVANERVTLITELDPAEVRQARADRRPPVAFPGLLDRFLKQSSVDEEQGSERLSALLVETAQHLRGKSSGIRDGRELGEA